MRHGGVRPDADGLAAGRDGLFELALGPQGVAEIEMGLDKVGMEPDRLTMSGNRFVRPALGGEDGAEIAMCWGKARVDADCVSKGRRRFVELALVPQGISEIGEKGRVSRVPGNGLTDQVDRDVVTAHLERNHAQQMRRIGAGIGGQHLAVQVSAKGNRPA